MVHSADPVLVEVLRGDYLECLHHGSVVVTAPDGSVRFSLGDITSPVLSRSALKPLQAIAMLRNGLDLSGAELALAGASHSGESFHLATAQRVLQEVGLSEDDLQTTPGLPLDEHALLAWAAAGNGKTSLAHNCSGKHSAMLRTCLRAGWPIDNYLDETHPLQQAIAATITEFTDEKLGAPVTDGCGAPAFATSIAGLARAFGTIAAAESGPARQVADAFRAYPEYASGTQRAERLLHQDVPGLVCKVGAEGALAAGLADGTGIVVKVDDGQFRAAIATMTAVLAALGYSTKASPEPVLGHGKVVGVIRISASFAEALISLKESAS